MNSNKMFKKKSQDKREKEIDYKFYSSAPNFRIVIITGVCRSGKTTLGQILGSMKNVEYIDEPWTGTVIPVMQNYGALDPLIARDMFRAFVKELFNDIILLRQSNFRPKDLSNIWDRKDAGEIIDRLVRLYSRDDVHNYVKEKDPILLLNLAELIPFLPFFVDTFPKCKIIHVTRNGLDVALDVAKKQWFPNEKLKKPLSNYYLFRIFHSQKEEKYYMPWWVREGEEEKFLGMNDFAKGLYYWRRILEINQEQIAEFKTQIAPKYQEIKFEDIVQNPQEIANKLAEFLGVSHSQKTSDKLSSLNLKQDENKTYPLEEVPADELKKAKKMLARFHYPTNF